MSTLLLRLAAPMQSWGVDSRFDRRNTGRSPSKSGVVGLCAAALGIRRDEDERIEKLANLKFGVRMDNPGKLIKDFHMAHTEAFWDPDDRSKINRDNKNTSSYLTIRYYLSDATFLAGLEGDEDFLREIDSAIRAPMFPLYLGRRGCPPEGRVSLGVIPDGLQDALENYPPVAELRRVRFQTEDRPRIVMDTDTGYDFRRDLPRSFNPKHRKYDSRRVREFEVSPPLRSTGEHDALAELETPLCT